MKQMTPPTIMATGQMTTCLFLLQQRHHDLLSRSTDTAANAKEWMTKSDDE